jgi:hypothetical protein
MYNLNPGASKYGVQILAICLPHKFGPKRYHKRRVLTFRMHKIASKYKWRLLIYETVVANDRKGAVCYIWGWTQVSNKILFCEYGDDTLDSKNWLLDWSRGINRENNRNITHNFEYILLFNPYPTNVIYMELLVKSEILTSYIYIYVCVCVWTYVWQR